MNFAVSTWNQWNDIYTTTVRGTGSGSTAWIDETSSTTGTASAKIWTAWNRTYVVSTTINETSGCNACTTLRVDPWVAWNRTYSATSSITDGVVVRPVETPEQAQRRIADRARWIQLEGERALARDRAKRILQENLTAAQRDELAQKGHFTLTLFEGDQRRLYRIKQGRSRNVQQVDDNGRVLKTLCAHPAINCPDEDTMLAQKLMLETQEREFLRIANHS